MATRDPYSDVDKAGRDRRFTSLLVCLLVAAAGLAVYWPAKGYGFINIDDHVYFSENDHVLAGLTWSNLVWAFQTTLDASWYPLSWLSFMVDAQVFGRSPMGPHITNVVWHMANSALLFLLLRRLTGELWKSAFVAALFALHPLHVESVAWISERKDVLSMFFGLLTLLAYGHYTTSGAGSSTRGAYLLALLLFMLGLLAKPMLVTLPCLLLLLDYWPLRRLAPDPGQWFREPQRPMLTPEGETPQYVPGRRLLWEKVPFLALSIGASVVTVVVHHYAAAIAPLRSVSVASRIGNALVSYTRYLQQTLWPTNLALPYLHEGHWPLTRVLWGGVVVGAVSLGVWWLRRRRPYLVVGWLWFLGTLVPVIGLIQWGNQAMADRFMYLPSIGLYIALAWGLGELLQRWRLPQALGASAALLMLLALGLRTRDQLHYWRDSETLFQHTIDVTTGNYVAYDCVGSALERSGKHEAALRYLTEAVRLEPRYPEARYDLGTALLRKGDLAEAAGHLAAAVKYNPTFANAHINLGKALLGQGKTDEAAAQLAEAVRLAPEDPEAYYNLGTVQFMQSKPDAAIACYLEALRLRPNYAEAHGNLGIALIRQGKLRDGVMHLSTASRLSPNNPEAHRNLGLALLDLNHPREAADEFSTAVRLNPDSANAHYHLALALAQQGMRETAVRHAQKALELAKAAGEATLCAKAEELLTQYR